MSSIIGLQPSEQGLVRRHLVWAAVAGAYLCVFPYFRAVNNPNENVRVWATRALGHHGTFSIDPVIREWGDVGDRAVASGRRYSSKAPGTSLLGVPVHFLHDRLARALTGASPSPRASTWALRVFTVVLPLQLFLLVFGRRVEAESGSPWARDLLLLGLGLGTLFYPYGLAFVGHAQSAALLFSGFLLLHPRAAGSAGSWRLALAGVLTGLAPVFEYQTLVAAAVLAGYAIYLHRRRGILALLPFFLGALVPALLLGGYHAALFGRPWTLPYAHLDDETFAVHHHGQGFLGLSRPRLHVLVAASAHVDYGLFVFSPFLAVGLGLALWAVIRRGSPPHAVVLLVTGVMAVFLAGMANWRGGWCAGGPRYIAAVVPFLVWSVALSWREVLAPRPLAAAVLAGLVGFSVLVCGLSGAIFPHFPLQFDNPIFDLVLPLLARGFAPHSLGTALGLHGLSSLLPLALLFLVALATAFSAGPGPTRQRVGAAALAMAVAGLLLGLLGAINRRPSRQEERARHAVMGMWEPPPGGRGGGRGNP
jgi:hypothetical protein